MDTKSIYQTYEKGGLNLAEALSQIQEELGKIISISYKNGVKLTITYQDNPESPNLIKRISLPYHNSKKNKKKVLALVAGLEQIAEKTSEIHVDKFCSTKHFPANANSTLDSYFSMSR